MLFYRAFISQSTVFKCSLKTLIIKCNCRLFKNYCSLLILGIDLGQSRSVEKITLNNQIYAE